MHPNLSQWWYHSLRLDWEPISSRELTMTQKRENRSFWGTIAESEEELNGEGNSNPLQYSCLENLRERGACRTIVHGIAESDTTDNWAIFWLCWIFIAMHGFSLVVASGGYSSLRRRGFSLSGFSCCRTQALGTQASLVALCGLSSCGSRALECWLSCSEECGIFPDQRLNQCPLCCKAEF